MFISRSLFRFSAAIGCGSTQPTKMENSHQGRVLTTDTMNPNVKNVEYAISGPIVQRAWQIEKELKAVSLCEESL